MQSQIQRLLAYLGGYDLFPGKDSKSSTLSSFGEAMFASLIGLVLVFFITRQWLPSCLISIVIAFTVLYRSDCFRSLPVVIRCFPLILLSVLALDGAVLLAGLLTIVGAFVAMALNSAGAGPA